MKVIDVNSGYLIDICIKEMCLLFDFSLRKCNRYINLISLVYENVRDGNIDILATCIFFPIILAIKIKDINLYERVISGNGEKELKEIILKSREIVSAMNYFLQTEDKETELTFDFTQLYNIIFVNKKEIGFANVKIGNRNIEYAHSRRSLMEMLTFLTDFTEF